MNAHTELTWWSPEHLDGIAGQIDRVVGRWRRDWRSTAGRGLPAVRNVQMADDVSNTSWLRHGGDDEPAVWVDGASLTAGTLGELFGSPTSAPLAQAVGASAGLDLIERLCRRMSVCPKFKHVTAPPVAPWMGYVDLTIPFANEPARFLLNAASVMQLVDRQRKPMTASAPRPVMEAVQALGVSLQVRLKDVELNVSDLQTLQAGDLIVLDHTLGEPLSLHSREQLKPLPCDAYLGKIGECKAVQLHIKTTPGETRDPESRVH